MAKFTSTSNHNVALTEIDLPNSEKTRIHLVDVKARVASDIKLVFGSHIQASIRNSPYDGPKGIWIVDVEGKSTGKATLSAEFNGNKVASVDINVFTKVLISLPLENTVEGMLTRLFLAESINPGHVANYDALNSKKSMIWMRQVIENRLKHKTPNIFGAKKPIGQTGYTVYDIVKAKGQFHGFESYPKLLQSIKVNINGFVNIANNYNHSKRESYAEFINNAKNAASKNALASFTDPSPKGLYGWRTLGSGSPGGSFKKYKDLAGQTFYTLN